jgi:hypothetical protein
MVNSMAEGLMPGEVWPIKSQVRGVFLYLSGNPGWVSFVVLRPSRKNRVTRCSIVAYLDILFSKLFRACPPC